MADQKETGLPPQWEVRHSNSKNLPYYFDTSEKNSSWEPPPGTDTEKLKLYMAKYHSGGNSSGGGAAGGGGGAAAGGAGVGGSSGGGGVRSEDGATTNGGNGAHPGKIRAAHLLVKHEGSRRPASWRESHITRTKSQALSLIQDHERRIKSTDPSQKISLGDLALTESDCVSARKHGDLGYFGRGDMQKEFEDAAFALRTGEVSGVVDTASGLHLIQRLD